MIFFKNIKDYDLNDYPNLVFYEDNLKSYKILIDNKFLIPTISGDRAGNRVYDSFNLMPSFIRNLIKIDNEKIVDVDFKCFHPNLAIKLYGGKTKHLTHEIIAQELKLDVRKIKKEHLSFFNKRPINMKSSSLYKYYEEKEPQMLERLINDKNKFGHKINSEKILKLEVQIMTECIKRLNVLNIYPLCIHDALVVKISDRNTTESIMNSVVIQMGVFTTVSN
jgi:hypothetical protein